MGIAIANRKNRCDFGALRSEKKRNETTQMHKWVQTSRNTTQRLTLGVVGTHSEWWIWKEINGNTKKVGFRFRSTYMGLVFGFQNFMPQVVYSIFFVEFNFKV